MYTVYILQDRTGRLYKGMTNDLERRLAEHRRGHTKTTSSMEEIEVVYQELFKDFADARARERYLKTAAGRRFLKKLLCARSSVG